MPATLLNLSSNLAIPAVTAFLPLYAREMGLGSVALFYVIAGIGSMAFRVVLGRRSDHIGRGQTIGVGLALQFGGLLLVVVAGSLTVLILGGVLAALGQAVVGASTTALAMDVAEPETRGRAMGTYGVSIPIGQGLGAMIAGFLADEAGMQSMYISSMLVVGLAMVLLLLNRQSMSRSPSVRLAD